MLKTSICNLQVQAAARAFSCTSVASMKEWRMKRGLPINKNAEGILTDGPDYSFLDGRPTPLLHKQKLRLEKQQAYASRIVELCTDLDIIKKRYQDSITVKQEERENIIKNRLRPKGSAISKK